MHNVQFGATVSISSIEPSVLINRHYVGASVTNNLRDTGLLRWSVLTCKKNKNKTHIIWVRRPSLLSSASSALTNEEKQMICSQKSRPLLSIAPGSCQVPNVPNIYKQIAQCTKTCAASAQRTVFIRDCKLNAAKARMMLGHFQSQLSLVGWTEHYVIPLPPVALDVELDFCSSHRCLFTLMPLFAPSLPHFCRSQRSHASPRHPGVSCTSI